MTDGIWLLLAVLLIAPTGAIAINLAERFARRAQRRELNAIIRRSRGING